MAITIKVAEATVLMSKTEIEDFIHYAVVNDLQSLEQRLRRALSELLRNEIIKQDLKDAKTKTT